MAERRRPITSSPAAFISRALSVTDMVGDVLTRLIREAIYLITAANFIFRGSLAARALFDRAKLTRHDASGSMIIGIT